MRVKKWFALLLSVLLLVGVGCDGGRGGGNKGNTLQLNIWITQTNQPQYFLGWFKNAFETENTNITLNFVAQSNDKLSSGLDASFSGSDAPDMASTWAGTTLNGMLSGGVVADISDIMTKYEDKLVDAALLNKYEGKHYAAPIFGFTSPVIYYNKTVFDEYGFEPPKDYDSLKKLCADIMAIKNSSGKQRYETIVTGYTYHLMMALHARTCTVEDLQKLVSASSTEKGVYDAPGFLKGYQWLKDMVDNGVFAANCSGYNESTASNAFTLQKSLMIATTSLDLLELSNNAQFEVGAFLFPDAPAVYKPAYGEGATEASLVSGVYTDSFVVNAKKGEEKIAACKKVIDFLYSPVAQSKLFNYFLYPARKDVDYSGVDAGNRSVFDSTMKGIYEQAKTDGMGIFYMTYYAKAGIMGNLEGGVKQIMNGYSAETGYGSVKAFIDA